MTTTIDRVADAMEARRRELIAKPLASIWPELAKAAVEAMHNPHLDALQALDEAISTLDAILNEGEGK